MQCTKFYSVTLNFEEVTVCHIKCYRVVNFYISLEKRKKNCNVSATVRSIFTKCGMMSRKSPMYEPLKDLMLKIQDVLNLVEVGRTVAQLSHFLHFSRKLKIH